ncbi:MAG: hypothetical protein JOY84_12635 [Curvibacter sp.]|nr:hypothetical protein [Curvibacter sp.]
MAYAAYNEFLGAPTQLRTTRGEQPEFVVLEVTVAYDDALRVRRALSRCRHTGVVRCTPLPHDKLVKLVVRLPDSQAGDVMSTLMGSVPSGQIGRIAPWAEHLAHYQHARGE